MVIGFSARSRFTGLHGGQDLAYNLAVGGSADHCGVDLQLANCEVDSWHFEFTDEAMAEFHDCQLGLVRSRNLAIVQFFDSEVEKVGLYFEEGQRATIENVHPAMLDDWSMEELGIGRSVRQRIRAVRTTVRGWEVVNSNSDITISSSHITLSLIHI